MNRVGVLLALTVAVMLTGCSSAPTCDELAFYESAEGGKRIEAPEDLDGLDQYKEMVIPEASPRPPRDLSAGCIDRPPTLKTSKSEDN
jgi:uncharacterized lipoprotein